MDPPKLDNGLRIATKKQVLGFSFTVRLLLHTFCAQSIGFVGETCGLLDWDLSLNMKVWKQDCTKLKMMQFLIISSLLLSFGETRSLQESEEVQTVFHNLNVACRVKDTSLKICRECDSRYPSVCRSRTHSDCRCGDISLKNEGNFHSPLGPAKNYLLIWLLMLKYINSTMKVSTVT